MRLKVKKFDAVYSPMADNWEVETDEFVIDIKYLLVKTINGIKCQWQRIKGEDVEIELMKYKKGRGYSPKGMIVVLSWKGELKKEKLWEHCNPDQPKNLAKTVTVK